MGLWDSENNGDTANSNEHDNPAEVEWDPLSMPQTDIKPQENMTVLGAGSLSRVEWEEVKEAHARSVRLIHVEEGQLLKQLEVVLSGCPCVSELVNMQDVAGYSLLQHAVIQGRAQAARRLVLAGAELNTPGCGRPLHLAAKLGHVSVVQCLLECGADPTLQSAVCYPGQHSERARMSYNPHTESWSVCCDADTSMQDCSMASDIPLYFAVTGDNVQCVQALYTGKNTKLCEAETPLHLACLAGARKCMEYFSCKYPAWVQLRDHGYTPLQLAVRWGLPFIERLVLDGASTLVRNKDNQTLLQQLLNEMPVPLTSLSSCVSYLLKSGLAMSVNTLDHHGHTALHYAVRLLSKAAGMGRPHLHAHIGDMLQEALHTVRLLLQARANANVCNKQGDRSLHLLARTQYLPYNVVEDMLSLLLEHKANVSLVNAQEETVLYLFVNNGMASLFGSLTPPETDQVAGFISCLDLLRKYGAAFHGHRYQSSHCLLHCVLAHLSKLQHLHEIPMYMETDQKRADCFIKMVLSVVHALLRSGAGVNACHHHTHTDLHLMYYQLMRAAPVVSFPMLEESLLLLLHHGADATRSAVPQPLTSPAPNTWAPLLQSPALTDAWPDFPLVHALSLFSMQGKSHTYTEEQILHLVLMLYTAMGRHHGDVCIKQYLSTSTSLAISAIPQHVLALLRSLTSSPPSLRQSAATSVYVTMERRLSNVDKLPLPPPMQIFILGLQYVSIGAL